MNHLNQILELRDRGALFVVNHSGGKDSQAMLVELRQVVPADQIRIIHAELPEADWDGLREHIEATAGDLAISYVKSSRTFLGMVEDRHAKIIAAGKDVSPWPSPKYRQCTSDLKRTPIEKEIRRICKATGNNLVVDCVGLRAEESTDRAKATTFKFDARQSKAGREVYRWLPIHEMLIGEVWSTIERAGQVPHPAYALGMSRLSCRFCIMATEHDLRTAAINSPAMYRDYVRVERLTGKTFSMSRRSLEEITGISIDERIAA